MSKRDETLGIINLSIKAELMHHAKVNKSVIEILDAFKNLCICRTVNNSSNNVLKIELSNIKIGSFESVEKLKANISTIGVKEKNGFKIFIYCFE